MDRKGIGVLSGLLKAEAGDGSVLRAGRQPDDDDDVDRVPGSRTWGASSQLSLLALARRVSAPTSGLATLAGALAALSRAGGMTPDSLHHCPSPSAMPGRLCRRSWARPRRRGRVMLRP